MSIEEPLIRAAVAAAQRHIRTPDTRWATVDNHDPGTDQLTVVVDGDSIALPAVNATTELLAPGQRVLVLFSPPQGVHVIGARPAPPVAYTPELTNIDVGDGDNLGEFTAHGSIMDLSITLRLGVGAAVTGTMYVGLPFPGSSLVVTEWVLGARANIGGQRFYGGALYDPATSTTAVGQIGSDGLGLWATAVPAAWAPGDNLKLTGRYPMRLPIENTEVG